MKQKIIEILKSSSYITPYGDNVLYDTDFENIAYELIEEVKKDTKRAYNEGYEDGFQARNGLGANTSMDLKNEKK